MARPENYQYQSCLAPYIKAFILKKRLEGFSYNSAEYLLKRFDAFCVEQHLIKPVITRELIMEWGTIRDMESKITCSGRVSVVRGLALYMQSQGMEAYIPNRFCRKSHHIAYVLSDDEIREFFKEVDNYTPSSKVGAFKRLAMEYRILFRVIYCCGLRVSEARKIKIEDINLHNGSIRLMQSKGQRDRIVYLADDLSELCTIYIKHLSSIYNTSSPWLFPARSPDGYLCASGINQKFKQLWSKTSYAMNCDKTPTVHSLRHSFVVKRMNLWMKSEIPLKSMMPYLSKYLGHRSPDETFYYYHQIDSAFKIIRSKDAVSSKIIPEVSDYEE